MTTPCALMLPGWTNSGPVHWQTLWEAADPSFVRVAQWDWDYPVRQEWVDALDHAVVGARSGVVLVGHSLGCALVAHWAQSFPRRPVRGALLVAPSDPEQTGFSSQISGFAPMPRFRLPFRSIVVASSNDEYVTPESAAAFAVSWGSRFENVGALGHINSASNLGHWPEGRVFLEELLAAPV